MRTLVRQSTVFACLAAGLAAAGVAQATNGYFSHGYGATSKGLAGAGVAYSQDTLAPATNPAGMVNVGDRVDFGVALFSPRREYSVSGMPVCGFEQGCFPLESGTVKSGSKSFLIPHFGWNRMLDDQSSFGVAIYGNGGMNTDYPVTPAGGTFYAGEAGVNLMQLFIAPTYARKINDTASWGVTPVIAYQRFKAKGLGSFSDFSMDPANLTDRGTDTAWGFGVRLGVQAEVGPGVHLGLAYQSKMFMDEFDNYSGLFAEQGDFDIPANMTVGLAWDVTPTSTLLFDVQHIWYSNVDSVANPFSNLTMEGQPLGADNGPGFGWRDMTIAKIGYQWQTSPDWTWRLGYSYGKQPIRDSEVLFNILAPGVMEHHVTFGFTRELGTNNELNFAAMYAPTKKVSGENPLAPGQEIELKMQQFEIEASYAWKF
jgi:long-chain fatty acid transport protein